ncbi:unnamed protein product, partial [Amoebophrya sp. A120]
NKGSPKGDHLGFVGDEAGVVVWIKVLYAMASWTFEDIGEAKMGSGLEAGTKLALAILEDLVDAIPKLGMRERFGFIDGHESELLSQDFFYGLLLCGSREVRAIMEKLRRVITQVSSAGPLPEKEEANAREEAFKRANQALQEFVAAVAHKLKQGSEAEKKHKPKEKIDALKTALSKAVTATNRGASGWRQMFSGDNGIQKALRALAGVVSKAVPSYHAKGGILPSINIFSDRAFQRRSRLHLDVLVLEKEKTSNKKNAPSGGSKSPKLAHMEDAVAFYLLGYEDVAHIKKKIGPGEKHDSGAAAIVKAWKHVHDCLQGHDEQHAGQEHRGDGHRPSEQHQDGAKNAQHEHAGLVAAWTETLRPLMHQAHKEIHPGLKVAPGGTFNTGIIAVNLKEREPATLTIWKVVSYTLEKIVEAVAKRAQEKSVVREKLPARLSIHFLHGLVLAGIPERDIGSAKNLARLAGSFDEFVYDEDDKDFMRDARDKLVSALPSLDESHGPPQSQPVPDTLPTLQDEMSSYLSELVLARDVENALRFALDWTFVWLPWTAVSSPEKQAPEYLSHHLVYQLHQGRYWRLVSKFDEPDPAWLDEDRLLRYENFPVIAYNERHLVYHLIMATFGASKKVVRNYLHLCWHSG